MANKNIIFLILSLCSTTIWAQTPDPVIMKINGKPIHKSEFEYLYHKNTNEGQQTNRNNVNDYLDLFINYKLKIEEAKSSKNRYNF